MKHRSNHWKIKAFVLFALGIESAVAASLKVTPANLESFFFLGGRMSLVCYRPDLALGRLRGGRLVTGATVKLMDAPKTLQSKTRKLRRIKKQLKRNAGNQLLRRRKKQLAREVSELRAAIPICLGDSPGSNSSSSAGNESSLDSSAANSSAFSRSSRSSSSSSFSYGGSTSAVITIDEPQWYHKPGVGDCDPNQALCYFPDFGMSLRRGYAPFPVFFQGSGSTPAEAIVSYSWDFGAGSDNDPHGRYFEGINAAHVFTTPGTYEVALVTTDYNGLSNRTTTNVTVLEPQGPVFYVDSSIGNDSCDGLSSTLESASRCPWKTAAKAFSGLAKPRMWAPLAEWLYPPGTRVLFRRGQVFEIDRVVNVGHGYATQGVLFGAYGDTQAAKPLVQWKGGSDGYIIGYGWGKGYWSFVDLQFNFKGLSGMADGLLSIICGGKNILFLRCDFFEPRNGAWSFNGGTCMPDDNRGTNGFMFDSSIQNPTTADIAVTQMYHFGAHGLAIIGNTFDQSGNHIEYSSSLEHAVVARNIFSRPAFGRTAWRTTGSELEHPTRDLLFADNYFLGWIDPLSDSHAHNGGGTRYNYHLINLAPGGNPGPLAMQDIIFERNVVTNFESGMDIVNAHNVTLRNNIFVSPSPLLGQFLQLSAAYGSLGLTRPLKNIRIIGNTFLSVGADATGYSNKPFINIYDWTGGGGVTHEGLVIKNNIFHALSTRTGYPIQINGQGEILSNLLSNYNLFFFPGSPSWLLSQWRTSSGQDGQSVQSDPAFLGPIPVRLYLPGEPTSMEENYYAALEYTSALHLSASSPRGIAELLQNDSYFDFDLIPRYLGDSQVDPGAFEYAP